MRFLKRRKLKKKGMSVSKMRKTGERHPVINVFQKSIVVKGLIGLVTTLFLMFLIATGIRYYDLGLSLGQVADEDVYTSYDITYRDPKKTDDLRMAASKNIRETYGFDGEETKKDLEKISNILRGAKEEISEEEEDAVKEQDQKRVALRKIGLADEQIDKLMASEDSWKIPLRLENILSGFYEVKLFLKPSTEIKSKKFSVSTLPKIKSAIKDAVEKEFAKGEKEVALKLSSHFLSLDGKYIYEDAAAWNVLQAEAEDEVPMQYTTIKSGTKIIAKGKVVTADNIRQLRSIQEQIDSKRSEPERFLNFVAISFIIISLIVFTALYLSKFQKELFDDSSHLVLLAGIIVVTVALSKLFVVLEPFALYYLGKVTAFLKYPIFVPLAAIILTMMFDIKLALVLSIVISVLLGVLFDNNLSFSFVGIVGGFTAAFYVRNVRRRSELVRAALMIGGVNFLVIFALGILNKVRAATPLLEQCAGGVGFGVISAFLATGILPVLESVFKITTNISLVELSDLNHPLLRRLVMEAPGTYHHSLVVGNLGEAAAKAVDANPLLTRVAAYFHDIGKMKKPSYFSENEQFSTSKHDTLNPSMSSLIIVSHVKEGVDLACKHKLNREIVDIIKEHHGTSLVYYFYKRAEEINGSAANIDENDFRYPGPKPQSKEAAIIMLADSVEAASRSLEKPSTSKIRSLIKEIIAMRFNDGQLDECDLTIKDIHKIEEAFSHILVGTLHPRVKYPKEEEKAQEETDEGDVQEFPKVVKH